MKKLLDSLESTPNEDGGDKNKELELLFKLEKSLTDTEKCIKDKLPKDNLRNYVKSFKDEGHANTPMHKKYPMTKGDKDRKHKCCNCAGL